MILSEKLSGYEQTIREKNLQLTELQLYINNIARCLCIGFILSARKQDYQLNTLIKCYNLFTGELSTDNNNIQQVYDIHQNFRAFNNPKQIFITQYVLSN